MSIATQTGDTGQTSLIGGRRISKGHARVEAYGTVDELIAQIGLARALSSHQEAAAIAKQLQRDLFAVAEALASDNNPPQRIDAARVNDITSQVHRIEAQNGILIDWAIAGDDPGGAAFEVARTVCRRAERLVVRLADGGERIDPSVIVYLNRLADLLWLLGRLIERDHGVDAVLRRPGDGGPRWSKAWP
ncbi:MAG: cob(I)yrinic acid a,c-diamide adenosyltransferase [Vicinamibacterales bacterium]